MWFTIDVGSSFEPFAPRLEGPPAKRGNLGRVVSFLCGVGDLVESIAATLLRRLVVRLPQTEELRTALSRFRSAEVVFAA